MKKILICFLCVILLCGCSNVPSEDKNQKLNVVTTIFPLYDFARAVGGDKADVKMLIKPGAEVHNFDPLPSDMVSVYDCDMFLYIGGESDKWVNALTEVKDVNALALIDSVDLQQNHSHHGTQTHTDEHIWTSFENSKKMIKCIYDMFIKTDAENIEIYRKNYEAYIEKIDVASGKMSELIKQYENPFIVVADRFPFAYFFEENGIDYEAAFDSCAINTDISIKTMKRLTNTIKSKNVKTVFCTEISSKNIANTLHEELGVKVAELHSAHNVTLDDFNNGITYVDIIYRNIAAIGKGLSK